MTVKLLSHRAAFGVSKLNRKLPRLVRVYSCQITALLDITCRCSIIVVIPCQLKFEYGPTHEILVLIAFGTSKCRLAKAFLACTHIVWMLMKTQVPLDVPSWVFEVVFYAYEIVPKSHVLTQIINLLYIQKIL